MWMYNFTDVTDTPKLWYQELNPVVRTYNNRTIEVKPLLNSFLKISCLFIIDHEKIVFLELGIFIGVIILILI